MSHIEKIPEDTTARVFLLPDVFDHKYNNRY